MYVIVFIYIYYNSYIYIIILHYIILYHIMLYCILLYSSICYCIMLYHTILYYIILYYINGLGFASSPDEVGIRNLPRQNGIDFSARLIWANPSPD